MASFADLLATFDPDAGKRGRQFEHFVKWFLKNDPEWATQVDEVWLWNDYPGQWGRDCGIDLIFKDKNAKTWAVQAKCYSPDYEITKSDVDKFLSESNRKEINHRLLMATTDRIGANGRQVLDGQEKSVVRYHLTHFENAAVEYPDSIESLSVAKRKPPPEPRPYQIEAIENVVSGFRTASRGQLIMACGTGKTFVGLWVKERLKAKRMPAISRGRKLKRLKNIGTNEIGLLSNARCLSEGVDVPALDGVAFIDPRGSEIDIIQSVGRAIRLSDNKTMGTIVIPVFIQQTESAEEVLEASDFKPIWDVLEALKSHDDRLSSELDQLRIELGAKRKRSVGVNDLTKIVFDLPTSVDERFAQSLRAYLVAQTTESWMFWYGMLETFAKSHKHCRVPANYKSPDGYKLGGWVGTQRADRDKLSSERRVRLEALGFDWNPHATQWEKGFEHLQAFVSKHGHTRVLQTYESPDGFKLGQWVSIQRTNRDLSSKRKARLDALGFDWDVIATLWEEGFAHLRAHLEKHNHCDVPALYKSPDGYALGTWASFQRVSQDKLSSERKARLNALGFDWHKKRTLLTKGWEEGLKHLQTCTKIVWSLHTTKHEMATNSEHGLPIYAEDEAIYQLKK